MSSRTRRQVWDNSLGKWKTELRTNSHLGGGGSAALNSAEVQAFMDGKKRFAVITGAASAGISLHADRGCNNQRRRVMLVTELTWSAENTVRTVPNPITLFSLSCSGFLTLFFVSCFSFLFNRSSIVLQSFFNRSCILLLPLYYPSTHLPVFQHHQIQQLGRIHRSNEVSPPMYEMVVSSLGGESRFVGAVTSRLLLLGALTKGDRGSSLGDVEGSKSFTEQTLLDIWGTKSLRNVCRALVHPSTPDLLPPSVFNQKTWDVVATVLSQKLNMDPRYSPSDIIKTYLKYDLATYRTETIAALEAVGISKIDVAGAARVTASSSSSSSSVLSIKKFFNRLGGLPVVIQQNLFNHFRKCHDAVVDKAKAEGKYIREATVLNTTHPVVRFDTRHGTKEETEKETEEVVFENNDVKTTFTHILADRGVTFSQVKERLLQSMVDVKSLVLSRQCRTTPQMPFGSLNGLYKWTNYDPLKYLPQTFAIIEVLQNVNDRSMRKVIILTPHHGEKKNIGTIIGYERVFRNQEWKIDRCTP